MSALPATNPWLSIPADDYENHMGSPAVRQLQFLNETFRKTVEEFRPSSVVIPGCTTGNGFEHLDPAVTKSIVGIDINPLYLGILFRRFGRRLPGLTLVCADMNAWECPPASADLLHCALVLEYVDPDPFVARVARWLKPGGLLSVVLQLPSRAPGNVTLTPFTSVRRLESIVTLRNPHELTALALRSGLRLHRADVRSLLTSKTFFVALYRLAS
jgi:SAM-dependent methyltransferase